MRVKLNYLMVALVSLFLTSFVFAQYSDKVVAEFDGHEITLGEFENAYSKNVGGIEKAKEDSINKYKDFLDLYVTYKMKLRDAFVRDYRNDEDMNKELEDYKFQVGKSFVEEKKIVDPGLHRFYNERGEELRVAHIMFKKGNNPDSSFKFAQTILDSIKNGVPFEKMVLKYSQDAFSRTNKGDIYWFTAGQVIPSFEEAAYKTKVGEVYPEVVETKFGFHIIKLNKKEKRRYKIRAKHILVKVDPKATQADLDSALAKITRIKMAIVNGADFDSLARKYSDDPGSGSKGGDLGFFERRMMVKPFDEEVFQLKVGELSSIVRSRFGYHLIMVTDEKEYPPYEEEVANIRDMYKKSRYNYDYDMFIDSLKNAFKYSLNQSVVNKILKGGVSLSEDYKDSEIYKTSKDDVIIKLGTENFTVADMLNYLEGEAKFNNKELNKAALDDGIKEYTKNILLSKVVDNLEKNSKEFASLMDEYRNGIYIFKLQEDEVWNKVKLDTVKMHAEYEKSKDNFKVSAKVKYSELFSPDQRLIKERYAKLLDGAEFKSLVYRDSTTKKFKVKIIEHPLEDIDKNEIAKQAFELKNVNDFSKPIAVKGGWAILRLNEKIPERNKTYSEALPELASAFQESESKRLEKKYNDDLKNFYKPVYYYDVLEYAFKSEK